VALILRSLRPSSSPTIKRFPISSDTRFFTPPPNPAAIAQIAELSQSQVPRHAALITGLGAVPQASWLTQGTPDEVHATVAKIMIRASAQKNLPILVSYNRPFRDCAGYSTGGALDTQSYKAWMNGLAKGIGNQAAMLILEPDGLGIIPFYRTLDGTNEWCKPMVLDARGKSVPAPGASPLEVYDQINFAVDTLKAEAPNTLVYVDGTHSNWLPVGESAHRLVKAGVLKTRGFSLNVANFQTTWKEIYYGNWVSRCIYFTNHISEHKGQEAAYRACPAQPAPSAPREAWDRVESWYRHTIDDVAHPSPTHSLVHFVIDTSRNGRGPLDPAIYADAPYDQPTSVLTKLGEGSWCNPPSAGVGIRTTIDTGHPLLDAFLWVKTAGESDGSCDIASGARAWDFHKFNPWGLSGESQNRFDPLWGMVVPAAGTWFPTQALRLAENANPPLVP
jgi:endoglucanase